MRAFVLARAVTTLLVPLLVLAFFALQGSWPAPSKLYMFIIGGAVVGLYLPNLYIDSRASNRRDEILNGFPDTLDLMLVCVEAGLSIDASFSRVGTGDHSTRTPCWPNCSRTASLELRAGRTRGGSAAQPVRAVPPCPKSAHS